MDNQSYYDKISSTSSSLYDTALGHESKHDRYTDMEEIGEGVIKKIKRVLDLTSGRVVAMAVPQKNLSKEQLQRFLEEARLTASLEHSNIMQVYDLGFNQAGSPYFTMKLCSSKKFDDLIEDPSTSLFQLLDIFLRVCEALSYAHNAGAVHRDLKPENILLGNFGEVMVCDWGSAQVIPDSILESEVGLLSKPLTKGSPGFMAPEQSTTSSPSRSQDIYTLGAILYQILTRKDPVPEKNISPSEVNSNTPAGLEAICLKAMAHSANDRYQQVDDIIKEIKAWLSGFAPQAEQASFHKQLKLMLIRHKALSTSVIASLLIISCLSLFYIINLKDKEKQTRTQRDRAEKALDLYDLEKESRKKIAALGADHFIDGARQMVNIHSLPDAEDLLNALPVSAINPDQQKKINAIKARIAFYRQQFKKSIELYLKGKGEDKTFLLKVAQRFLKIKPDDSKILGTKDMLDILETVNRFKTQHAYGLYRYQVLHFTDIMEQVHLIEKMILINNEDIAKLNIKMTNEKGKYHLDVSNNPKMKNMVPIRKVPLSSLSLANCPIIPRNFTVLFEMPLEELNLSGCKLTNYSFIKEMKSLKKLILNPKEAKTFFKQIPETSVKVIIKDVPRS